MNKEEEEEEEEEKRAASKCGKNDWLGVTGDGELVGDRKQGVKRERERERGDEDIRDVRLEPVSVRERKRKNSRGGEFLRGPLIRV
ncbi:hypothetical protein RUM44_002728 [Polyplax serrata]|uniref:Uncharacterized protein n=1 Tax=Polyplax serrata TaxID=468196 RepID=A0ABR1AFL5_POLSC